MIEGHGDDLYSLPRGMVKHNFSTNIYAAWSHRGLMEHLLRHSEVLCSYPEPQPQTLAKRIAGICGVDAANITVTNGATEAIYLIAEAYSGAKSAIMEPTFREYGDACRLHGHMVQSISDFSALGNDVDTVWLCNPNNPTGEAYDPAMLESEIRNRPSMLFVIDHAYADYSVAPVLDDVAVMRHSNLVILKSLTKRFGIPGLRIGYALSSAETASRLAARRMPWSVNGLAIEAAKYLIDHRDSYMIDNQGLHGEALRIARALAGAGIDCSKTQCNFLTGRLPKGTAANLKSWLVREKGILIRDASNFHTLTGNCFRVAAQDVQANNLLIESIKEWLQLQS